MTKCKKKRAKGREKEKLKQQNKYLLINRHKENKKSSSKSSILKKPVQFQFN